MILLNILANLDSAVVLTVLILLRISSSPILFSKFQVDNVKEGDMHAEANKVIRPPARLML